MKKARPLVLAITLLCTTHCTKPGETTGVGAAAGGVVGAGLGAIVGAQTGSVGAGVAIGTAAGVASGALVGNALQAQEETNRTQDEAIERQQQMIAAHGRQIDEYKRSRDGGPTNGTLAGAPRGAQMGYSYPGSTLKLSPAERQRLMRGEQPALDSTRGRYQAVLPTEHSHGVVTGRRSQMTRPEPKLPARSAGAIEGGVTARAVTDLSKAESMGVSPTITEGEAKTDSSGLTERNLAVVEKTTEATSETHATLKAKAGRESSEAIPPAPVDNSAVVGGHKEVDSVAKVTQPPSPASEECQQAEEEVTKAGGSKELADKLFHYRRAIRLCPNNAEYHLGLGTVYKSLNRTTDAEFEFREALRINPSLTVARDNLEHLRF